MSQISYHQSQIVVFYCPQKQKIYNIYVEPDTLISEISNSLYDCLQCLPNEKCVLYFKNQELSIDQTLQYYGIGKGNQIEIKIEQTSQPESQEISLNILVPQHGRKYQIQIMDNTTIEDLTTKIQPILKLDKYREITLVFEGWRLCYLKRTLAQLNIPNQGSLTVHVETEGGF